MKQLIFQSPSWYNNKKMNQILNKQFLRTQNKLFYLWIIMRQMNKIASSEYIKILKGKCN